MLNSKCKICRRLKEKLLLKGEKCLSPKCPMIKKPYPPGQKRKKRVGAVSEYGRELAEKQKLRYLYNCPERQLERYVQDALKKRGTEEDPSQLLIKKLESRLDNVVFRLGLAVSRSQARQLVSHGHVLVNGKKTNISSYPLKKGDKITLSKAFQKSPLFEKILISLKKYQPPSWLSFNSKELVGQVKAEPTLEEAKPPVELSAIFEYYSR